MSLFGIERVGDPVCIVYWPDDVGLLWAGINGTAKIYRGEPLAVLSSGEQVPL